VGGFVVSQACYAGAIMSAVPEMEIFFRDMIESDLATVIEIEKEGHRYPWSQGIFQDCVRVGYYCPVLIKNDEIVAYGVMSVAAGEAHIFNVCVAPKFRRQKFGQQVMQHLLNTAKAKKSKSVFLEVRPSNQIAINLYGKLGFIEVGTRKNYYPADSGREDAVIMAMDFSRNE